MLTRAVASSVALLAILTLTACGDDDPAAPVAESTSPGSVADEPTPTLDDADDEEPAAGVCSLGALPGSAVIRMCAIALAPGGTRSQVVLTVDEPTGIVAASAADRSALEVGCANTIRDAGWNAPGTARIADDAAFITATLDVQGADWPASSLLYTAFGSMFQWGSAPNISPPNDSVSFGCFEALTFSGSGSGHLVGLIDAADYNGGIDGWLEFASFGFGEAQTSHTGVTFEDCTIELSTHADALNDRWLSPTEWGTGCVTGFMHSEHD